MGEPGSILLMGGAVFPSYYLTWGQTMVEVMKIMTTSFKRFHACIAALSAPNPAAGHRWPTLCRRLLDTHGQVWVRLSWGHCSFLLGSGAHNLLFVPSKSLFPQSCVSSGTSMVGLMVTSSKRAYVIPSSTTPRAPAPATVHCWPIPLQETLKHHSVSVSVGLLGPGWGGGTGGEGDDRGLDGWMASATQRTWVWVSSRSWWWTGKPGVLQSMGLQRVGHNWVIELNWTELRKHSEEEGQRPEWCLK